MKLLIMLLTPIVGFVAFITEDREARIKRRMAYIATALTLAIYHLMKG